MQETIFTFKYLWYKWEKVHPAVKPFVTSEQGKGDFLWIFPIMSFQIGYF